MNQLRDKAWVDGYDAAFRDLSLSSEISGFVIISELETKNEFLKRDLENLRCCLWYEAGCCVAFALLAAWGWLR